jgi:putative flippase GtrA
LTTRTDRLVSILAFAVSVAIVLAIAGIFFGQFGAVELVIALVVAIPLTIVLSRWLRTVVERRNRPA